MINELVFKQKELSANRVQIFSLNGKYTKNTKRVLILHEVAIIMSRRGAQIGIG